MITSFFKDYNKLIFDATSSIDSDLLKSSAEMIKTVRSTGKKIILAGNGGSAAIASHIAVDLTKGAGCRAVTFNESDLLTCFANDYGYERWVEKALEFYADKGDLVILISSSGTSPNIINGAKWAREFQFNLITLSGFSSDNPLRQMGNINLWANSKGYNIVEMTHHIWLVAIVDFIIGKIEYKAN